MNETILKNTVARLMEEPKGILAIDESLNTCNKRFEKLGIPTTEEKRREYRELLVTTPGIESYISGYILFDETMRQKTSDGESFISVLKDKGIEVGIKVDKGPVDFTGYPDEKITDGLEGLDERLKEYRKMGATFAKWRGIYTIGELTPSGALMKKNAEIFAKYALFCQENDIVPIVEPEILMDGNHSIEKCYATTVQNLSMVFQALKEAELYLPGVILKTSMVLPGKDLDLQVYDTEVAQKTVAALKEKVPEILGGIVFLSGGQDDTAATLRLNEMAKLQPLPWRLTFSYGRAIQNNALKSWAEDPGDVTSAQNLLLKAAENNSLASIGEYNEITHLRKAQ